MKKFKIHVNVTEMFADLITPVSIYLRIRDVYPNSLLLESSDYHGNENSFSFICLKPVATFKTDNGKITEVYPDGEVIITELTDHHLFNTRFTEFILSFGLADMPKEIPVNGLFGYTSYDMLEYFEKIRLKAAETPDLKIPETYYGFYNYIIAINHFQNKLYIIENQIDSQPGETERIKALLNSRNIAIYSFRPEGPETSNLSDNDYKSMVTKGKEHCHRGDVFQVVMSRQFTRKYKGDDFNVYRALRSINPS